MDKRWDILGVGSAAVDDVLYLEHFVQRDEKIPIQSWRRRSGGQTSTALVAAARFGARTAFCSCLGEDELSRFTLEQLQQEQVDCTLVNRSPASRPYHSVILVESSTGSRTILYSAEGAQEPDPQTIDPAWIRASRVLFVDQNAPRSGLQAARLAKAAGIPIVADLEYKPSPALEELAGLVDHLIVGIDYARRVTGRTQVEEMLRSLADPAQAACVITWGSRGCWYAVQGGECLHIPAFDVIPVDTTGCGDVFHGAYAAEIARGVSVQTAIRTASAAAALKASSGGGWSGIPQRAEVMHFLQTQA